jgi:hypothetical protein
VLRTAVHILEAAAAGDVAGEWLTGGIGEVAGIVVWL